MKKHEWSPQRRFERQYETLIQKLFRRAWEQSNPGDLVAILEEMAQSETLYQLAEHAALQMITGLSVQNARTWREAARLSMRGPEIYRALQGEMEGPVGFRVRQLVHQNAKLITGIPRTLAQRITKEVLEESQAGRQAGSIAADLRKQFPQMAASRIRLISRTEVSKASTALTQARAENLDLNWYVWRSSEDSRVRLSHRFMDKQGGILIQWSDAASPEFLIGEKSTLGHYHAGDCPNCRCYPEPLLRIDQVSWPHRVHRHGTVIYMSRSAFLNIAGAGVRIAA